MTAVYELQSSPTSDNLAPQETTNETASDMGVQMGLVCPV